MFGSSLMLIMGTSACQNPSTSNDVGNQAADTRGQGAAVSEQPATLLGLRGVTYTSMSTMAKDAIIVVRGTPVGKPTADNIGVVEFTVTTVKVAESFKGSSVGALLKVRQPGSPSLAVGDEFPPLLQADKEYILFLDPSGLPSKADEYYITGGAGIFRFDPDGNAKRLDAGSPKLPEKVTTQSIRKAVADSK